MVPKQCPKSDSASDTWRLVNDLSGLNQVMRQLKIDPPPVSAIFSALQGSNTYSALDMVQSFWQMRIDDQSAPATAFQVPPMDRYEFVRAPMGMQSSSSWMERNVRRVLSGFDTIYAVHYLDDILCFSGDAVDPSDERSRIARHLEITEKVLNRLWSFGVTLGVRKCTWAQPSADFLGHRVNADGIQPLPRLCQGIADLAEPASCCLCQPPTKAHGTVMEQAVRENPLLRRGGPLRLVRRPGQGRRHWAR